jgi:dienelactone hydrolase
MRPPTSPSRRDFLAGSGAALLAGSSARAVRAEEPERVPTVEEWIRQRAADAPLALRFRGTTAKDCRRWQAEFADKLRSLLGAHAPPGQWKTTVQRATDLEDHRREELLLTAEGHPPLPLYLLIPRTKEQKRRPGVLALHGHGAHGHHPVAGREDLAGVAQAIKNANYDYGRQLVRQGYVVAAPCLTPFGPRLGSPETYGKQDPCAVTFVRLQLLGKLLMAENLRDCLWALELLARHEQVDTRRLGCVGLSYGGRMTMLTAALEPRIGVAVVSGALNVMQERIGKPYSCGAQVIPGLLNCGDVPEIGSLIAPRSCVWEVGARDTLIAPKWADEALGRMRRAYRAYDAEDRLLVDRFDGGHEWSGRLAFAVLKRAFG